jgi:hypothetical protein
MLSGRLDAAFCGRTAAYLDCVHIHCDPPDKGTPARKPGSQSFRSTAFEGHDSGVANE